MSLELVKKIRQLTGAGMNDIHRALNEAKGDETKTIEILRKAGSKIAAKKLDRDVKEGVIALAKEGHKIGIILLGCETDFVARNEDFVKAANGLAQKLLVVGQDKFADWANEYIKNELIVKIGENLQLINFEIIEGDILGDYLHSNRKVATVVVLNSGTVELAKEIAMHATALAPKYLKPDDVPADILDKEKEIYTEQLKKEGKPESMLENILKGKVNKFYSEICLIKQIFIKDDKKTIEQLLKDNEAEIKEFKYYSL